jgi:hypothetical protein
MNGNPNKTRSEVRHVKRAEKIVAQKRKLSRMGDTVLEFCGRTGLETLTRAVLERENATNENGTFIKIRVAGSTDTLLTLWWCPDRVELHYDETLIKPLPTKVV